MLFLYKYVEIFILYRIGFLIFSGTSPWQNIVTKFVWSYLKTFKNYGILYPNTLYRRSSFMLNYVNCKIFRNIRKPIFLKSLGNSFRKSSVRPLRRQIYSEKMETLLQRDWIILFKAQGSKRCNLHESNIVSYNLIQGVPINMRIMWQFWYRLC